MLASGTQAFAGAPRQRFDCAHLLERIAADCEAFSQEFEGPMQVSLANVAAQSRQVVNSRKSNANPTYYNDFAVTDLELVCNAIRPLVEGISDAGRMASTSEDTPMYFDVNVLADHLERIAIEQGGNLAGFISTLGLRIRGMLADSRLAGVIARNPPVRFDSWLEEYIGGNQGENGSLTIIDLSLVPSEVIHIVVAVLGRVIFEALQRYCRNDPNGRALPTVLVLEEAHSFIHRGGDDEGVAATPARLCRETFERIAREGRKFGLGLVLSSQRPFELSPTVLAQCNTFLLHRIVNDADQNLVARLVPDNIGGLLRELPSLPSRQAIMLGWATPMPVLVEIDELPEAHRPRSSDPDFWDVWTHMKERSVDWSKIVMEWTGGASSGRDGSCMQRETRANMSRDPGDTP